MALVPTTPSGNIQMLPQYPNTYSSGTGTSYLSRYRPQNTRYNAYGGAIPNRNVFGYQSGAPQLSAQQAYSPALQQQAEDYSNIMQGYQGIMGAGGIASNPDFQNLRNRYLSMLSGPGYTPVTAQQAQYSRTAEIGEGFNRLRDLSETGGYTADELADLRARGVSPVRTAYANAMRELNRNRAIQGGYSPNFAAATTRMAREQSDRMAGALTDVNAGIAERVAAGRQAAVPQFANLAQAENALQAQFEQQNAQAANQVALANAANRSDWDRLRAGILGQLQGLVTAPSNQQLQALQGMTSLYGTTPALVNEFGQQLSQAAQLNQQAQAQNAAASNNLISQYMSHYPYYGQNYGQPVYG